MNVIRLDHYLPELTAMYSFYKYSEFAFQDDDLRERIAKEEFSKLVNVALPYLKVDLAKAGDFLCQFRNEIRGKVKDEIESGLPVLRRQILEASHSIFEKFLCHVVRVYFHVFPQILKDIDKQISFRTVAELKANDSIFDHVIEKEVSHFSRRSLQEKKDYLKKHLKLTHQDEVWLYEGEELWKDIDRKRQAIVHKEETPEISEEYLITSINALQKIMVSIAFYAQADQGVHFTWLNITEYVQSKDKHTLKG